MAKMAATGITKPAAGLLQTLKLALSYCTMPYAFPQELKDSIPLDGRIRNYDSAYHIIFTNVKTNSQIPLQTGDEPATACYSADIQDVFAAELGDGSSVGEHGLAVASWIASGPRIL